MATRVPLVPLARRVVLFAAVLAPRGFRGEFRAEWTAEIEWAAAQIRTRRRPVRLLQFELVRRSLGAIMHALWLRKEQWSLEMLWQDVKYAVRTFAGRPSFTLIAILTLALGIGANTAVFSVVYGVLLKPLPFADPDRLVQLWETNPLRNWVDATASPANLLDWKRRNRVFEDIAFYPGMDDKTPMVMDGTLADAGREPERLRALAVSTNLLQVLGVRPVLGRGFVDDEAQPGPHRVAILTYATWRSQFDGDPDVIGRDISINARPYRVVGVTPRDFRFPAADVQLLVPFVVDNDFRATRRAHYLRPIARLKPGVTIVQAREDLARIAADLERQYPDTNTKMGTGLAPLQDWIVGDVRLALLVFLGAVSVVLLVACANLANLFLARASGRQREFAIRRAVGGSGWRLAQQLLTESAVLACAAGVLGVVIAHAGLDAIVRFAPGGMPRLEEATIDIRMLLFVTALTTGAALISGLVPAWHTARADASWLREAGQGTGAPGRTRRLLVIAQVAAAVTLVVSAGLLLRSFERLQAVPPGFNPDSVLTFRATIPSVRYDDDAKVVGFFQKLLIGVRRIPGVTATGAVTVLGLEGQGWTGDLFVEGRPEVHGRELRHKDVTPGYFSAVGLPVVRGRDFRDSDTAGSMPVVVVNQALVRAYFAGEDPIGRRIGFSYDRANPRWQTIVGVVHDEKQNSLAEPVQPEVYGAFQQNPSTRMTVAVRTAVPPEGVIGEVRAALRESDPLVAMFDVRTLRDVVDASLARERFTAWIVGLFAAVALMIAAIGVFGVVSQSVSRRTHEIGVRVALGATRAQVVRLVLGEALLLIAAGVVAGFGLAAVNARVIRAMLFDTPTLDPLTYAAVLGVLAVVGFFASWMPMRRALAVDPIAALKYE